MNKILLSRSDAATYLGISVRTLDRLAHAGKIPYVSDRPGARVRYLQRDLDNYIRQHTHKHN